MKVAYIFYVKYYLNTAWPPRISTPVFTMQHAFVFIFQREDTYLCDMFFFVLTNWK